MTYETFQEDVISALRLLFPDNTVFNTQKVLKQGDRFLDALIISEPGVEVTPTIYFNPYYDALRAGAYSFDEIVHAIFELYSESRTGSGFDFDTFSDFEKAKSLITYRLLNRERNTAFLKDVPHLPYLDLALIFTVVISISGKGQGTVTIHTSHMKEWGVDVNDLYEAARRNTRELFRPDFSTISDSLAEMIEQSGEKLPVPDPATPLYILTNTEKTYGAAAILYEGLLKKIAGNLGADLYIIPSSVHETLLMPAGEENYTPDLNAMVREVNSVAVPDEEVLSDHVYYYSREKDAISMEREAVSA